MIGELISYRRLEEMGRQPSIVACSNLGCLSYSILYAGQTFVCNYCGCKFSQNAYNPESFKSNMIRRFPVHYVDFNNSEVSLESERWQYLSLYFFNADKTESVGVSLFCVDDIIDYNMSEDLFFPITTDTIFNIWFDCNNNISIPCILRLDDCQAIADMLNDSQNWQSYCTKNLWKTINYIIKKHHDNFIIIGGDHN